MVGFDKGRQARRKRDDFCPGYGRFSIGGVAASQAEYYWHGADHRRRSPILPSLTIFTFPEFQKFLQLAIDAYRDFSMIT